MRGKSDLISIKRKPFFVVLFLLLLLLLAIATPVLADYLGPNRTVTETISVCKVVLYECQYVPARDLWKYKPVDDWSCSNEGKPWQGYDNYNGECGLFSKGRTQWGKQEKLQTVTTTQPEATIASVLQGCALNNGWCNIASELSLTGTEPLSGYSILAVEGSLNGQTFACSGGNCSVPLNEGNNDFSFWALSSWGDSSQMGTFSAKVDTVPPVHGLDITSVSGSNGWYVSPTSLTATGSDSTSGLSSVFLSVDNGAWFPSTTLNEGVYNVLVQAEDNAGNVAQSPTVISVDTTTPTIAVSVNGTTGSNGWYSSGMQVSATANDATSGVGSLEASLDGEVYQAYNSPVSFADGYHTVQFKAVDKAGNETETFVQEFYVDTIAPAIDLPAEWEVNDTITYKVQDDGSGLSALRIVIEDEDEKYAKVAWDEFVSGNKFKGEITWNGKFKDGTVAPAGEYLVWVKISDIAGNESIGLGRVIVPQPFASFNLVQPSKSSTEIPTPPADLFVPKDSSPTTENFNPAPSSSTSFGGSTSPTNSTSVQSRILSSGTASASTTTPTNVLWGATAAALIGWATATALEEKKKRKGQEQAQAAQVKAEVDAFNEAQEAKRIAAMKQWKINSWLEGQAILNAQIEQLEQQGASQDEINALKEKAKTEGLGVARNEAGILGAGLREQKMKEAAQVDMTEQEKWEAYIATPEYIARQKRFAEWQQAEEKKQAQDLRDGLAAYYAATRQGEQEAKYGGPKVSAALALDDDPPWWKKLIDAGKKVVDDAKEWVSNHVVQPAKETVNKAITTVKDFVTTTVTTVKEIHEAVKNKVIQKREDVKQWVDIKVIQPVEKKWEEIVKFTNDVIDTVFPERKWQEFSESEKNQLLIELINSGELGRATAEYIVQEEVRLGYLSQPESGAGWTFSGNLSFPPNTDLTTPRTIVLSEHEILHISAQGLLTRFSVYGELQAWQLEYLAYYQMTGKYYGEQETPFFGIDDEGVSQESKWKELSQLSPDSRVDLERAQILMKEIAPTYRSNVLPLEPVHKEIWHYLWKGKFAEALNVISKLLSGR